MTLRNRRSMQQSTTDKGSHKMKIRSATYPPRLAGRPRDVSARDTSSKAFRERSNLGLAAS